MRISATPGAFGAASLPLWPPLLATRGEGGRSAPHAHHAMHLVVALDGSIRVRAANARAWQTAAGVLSAPDVAHAIDARGADVLLVFFDPESDAGEAMRAAFDGPLRIVDTDARDRIAALGVDPVAIMRARGEAWTRGAIAALGAKALRARRVHPRVRALLRHVQSLPPRGDTSLEALAAVVGLSPSRLMHAFTESIGLPLRPYLVWLKLQRAAAGIATGLPLAQAAIAAGFSDAAHMTRTFKRMFGMPPSMLRPPRSTS
jgi:AraC-like DNA-binding protein